MADNNAGPSKKKGRGKGKLDYLKNTVEGHKILVGTFMDKPVGDGATKLAHYIGIIARDGHLLPLSVPNWKAMRAEKIDQALNEIKNMFDYPETIESTIKEKLNSAWKAHKSGMKKLGFNKDSTLEENLANRPEEVVEDQWAPLVALWSSPKYQAATAKNKSNISKQTIKHTGGSKPHMAYAKELKDAEGEFPERYSLFKVTHTKNRHDPAQEVMEPRAAELYGQMVEIQERFRESGSGVVLSGRHDAVAAVMGPDRKGRVRCLGNTVKPKEFWGEQATVSKYAELQSENDRQRRRIEELERRVAELETMVATMNGYDPLQPPMPTDFNNEEDNGEDFFDAMQP